MGTYGTGGFLGTSETMDVIKERSDECLGVGQVWEWGEQMVQGNLGACR